MIEITGYRDGNEKLTFSMRLRDEIVTGHRETHWYNGYWHGMARPLKSWSATWREIDLLLGDGLRDATEIKIDGELVTKEEAAKYILGLFESVGRNTDVERLKKKDKIWKVA